MTQCVLCLKYTGVPVVHSSTGCPLGHSVLCRRCHNRGHLSSMCTEKWPQWERPTSLEELIPADIKLKYGITTNTPLSFTYPRGIEGSEVELSDVNEMVIPENYNELKEFIEKQKIKVEKVTKESKAQCLKAVKAWGVSHGYRIIIKDE